MDEDKDQRRQAVTTIIHAGVAVLLLMKLTVYSAATMVVDVALVPRW